VRQEFDQLQPALVKASSDIDFGDIVSAPGYPRANPLQMVFRCGQADVPDADLEALPGGLFEQASQTFATQGGLKVVIQPLGDGAL